jgi:hypothetical protein
MLELKEVKAEISKSAIVQGSSYSGNSFVISLADQSDNTRTLLAIDLEGKVIYKNTESKVDKGLLTTDTRVFVHSCMPDGTIVIQQKPSTKDGYSMSYYNMQFKQVWSKDIKQENGGVVDIVTIKQTNESIFVLKKETIGGKMPKCIYTLDCLNPVEGTIDFSKALKDESDYIFPVFVRIGDAGIFTGGLYYKDGKYTEGKPLGLMLLQYDRVGAMSKAKIPMNRLSSFLPDPIISAISEGGMLLVEDVFADMAGNLQVVCELITKKPESAKETAATISDLLLIKLNEQKDIEKLSVIEGVGQKDILIKGPLASANSLVISEWLYHNSLMSYKFSTVMGRQNIGYITKGVDDRLKFSITTVDSPTMRYTTEILINRLEDPKNKMKFPKKIIIDSSVPKGTKVKEWNYIGVYPAMGDKMKIYNYLPQKLVLAAEWVVQKRD